MGCFPFETLVSFTEGALDTSATQAVYAHLDSGCADCRQAVDWLRMVIGTMRTDDLQDPPRATMDRLTRYFKRLRPRPLGDPLRRFIEAVLLFDSSRQWEFSEARSVQGSGKQLLYQADHYDIDIRLHPADPPEYADLIGQVLAQGGDLDSVSEIAVHLCAADKTRRLTLTDPLGVFHLRQVPEGRYDLKIMLPDREIAIRDVSIVPMA